jgi:integrase
LGEFPAVSVNEARGMVLQHKGLIARGVDPKFDNGSLGKKMVTFGEYFEEYLAQAKVEGKKSWQDDETRYRLWLKDLVKLPLDTIGSKDISNAISKVRAKRSPGTANRVFALVRHVFNRAVNDSSLPCIELNPCRGIKKLQESSGREVFLNAQQAAQLLKALDADENRIQALAVSLLVFTGCRKGEVFSLKWENVSFDPPFIRLRWEDTKAQKARIVRLNPLGLEVLERVQNLKPYADCPWAFPSISGSKSGHISDLQNIFNRVKKKAGLPKNVRIHDLRHSFASLAVAEGVPLFEVQKLLGHSNIKMTQIYSHLHDDALQKASTVVSDAIANALNEVD